MLNGGEHCVSSGDAVIEHDTSAREDEEEEEGDVHPDSAYNDWTMRSYQVKSNKVPDWLRKFARSSTATHDFFKFEMCSYEELDSLQNNLLKLYREELHEIISHYEEYRLALAREIHLKTLDLSKDETKKVDSLASLSGKSSLESTSSGKSSLESSSSGKGSLGSNGSGKDSFGCNGSGKDSLGSNGSGKDSLGSNGSGKDSLGSNGSGKGSLGSSGSSSGSTGRGSGGMGKVILKRFSKSPIKKNSEGELAGPPEVDREKSLSSLAMPKMLFTTRKREDEEESCSPLQGRRTRELSIDGQRNSYYSSDDEAMSIGSFARAGSLREKESDFAPVPFVRSKSDRPKSQLRWNNSSVARQDGRRRVPETRGKVGIPRETYV